MNLLSLILFLFKFAVAPTQVAFGIGGASPSIRSYGVPKAGGSNNSNQGSAFKGMLPFRHSLSD